VILRGASKVRPPDGTTFGTKKSRYSKPAGGFAFERHGGAGWRPAIFLAGADPTGAEGFGPGADWAGRLGFAQGGGGPALGRGIDQPNIRPFTGGRTRFCFLTRYFRNGGEKRVAP